MKRSGLWPWAACLCALAACTTPAPAAPAADAVDAAPDTTEADAAADTGPAPDVSAGGFFVTGHAEAFAEDSKATPKIAFSVVDDLGNPVAVTVRQAAPEYRLEMLPPPEYPHYFVLTASLPGLEPVEAQHLYKPGWSGTPVTNTVTLLPLQLTRGAPISLCGLGAISPYDGTMIVRGLNEWRRLRWGPGGAELKPIQGAELTGTLPGGQARGGPIESCLSVNDQGKLALPFLPGGRFALLPRVGADYQVSTAVLDLDAAKVVLDLPAASLVPKGIGQTGDFAVLGNNTPQKAVRLRWDGGVATAATASAMTAGHSPEGRYFVQLQGGYARYDMDTQASVPLLGSEPTDLRQGPQLGWQGAFLAWSEANDPAVPWDCRYLAGATGGKAAGCTLRVVQPGGVPTTVTQKGYVFGRSTTSHALVYLADTGLVRYDVDSGKATPLSPQLTPQAGTSIGGENGFLTVGDQLVLVDAAQLWVVQMGTGAVVTSLPGTWAHVERIAGETVALYGISQLGREADPAFQAQGLLDTKTGTFTSTRGLYGGGKRQFALQDGILRIGNADHDKAPQEVVFTAAGNPYLAGGFSGPATFRAPCLPYVRPIAGKLTGAWAGYDTLCVP